MTHFKFVHEFNTDPEHFWRIFLDETYNDELYQRLGVKERTMLECQDDGDTRHWRVRVMPKRDLPGFLKKLLGGDLGYTETSTLWRKKNQIRSDIEPTLLGSRTKMSALYTIEPLAPGRVLRTYEGDLTVSVAVVGGRIESFIVGDLQRSYDLGAKVTEEWIAAGKLR